MPSRTLSTANVDSKRLYTPLVARSPTGGRWNEKRCTWCGSSHMGALLDTNVEHSVRHILPHLWWIQCRKNRCVRQLGSHLCSNTCLCLFVQFDGSERMDQDRGPSGCKLSEGHALHSEGEAHSERREEPIAVPRKEFLPPDVAAAAVCKRVQKLEAVLVTLGNDQVCKLEKERKRVEFARQTIEKAQEIFADAVAAQDGKG